MIRKCLASATSTCGHYRVRDVAENERDFVIEAIDGHRSEDLSHRARQEMNVTTTRDFGHTTDSDSPVHMREALIRIA